MKTKEQVAKYNREYFARPEVIARAKVRNAKRRDVRKAYKATEAGRVAEYRYTHTEKYKSKIAADRIQKRYGLTAEQYDSILRGQGGCAICGRSENVIFHVDHCHNTGSVRGILCGPCNMAIGLFKDDLETVRKAFRYLSKHHAV